MRVEAIGVEETIGGLAYNNDAFGPTYLTKHGKYILGLNLKPEQIERRSGGIQSGGETFLHVKVNTGKTQF